MSTSKISGSKLAKTLQEIFGDKCTEVTCPPRSCKDLQVFLRKISGAKKRAAKSTQRFGSPVL
ncbi:MAG TPA: hypothetical protein VFA52_03270 [Candidatus Paceibacterota bacterium]|nr:hypothetical protein [Candidatus Paceibacterota bacterium]